MQEVCGRGRGKRKKKKARRVRGRMKEKGTEDCGINVGEGERGRKMEQVAASSRLYQWDYKRRMGVGERKGEGKKGEGGWRG